MNNQNPTLQQLGWKPFFQQQLSLEDLTDYRVGRVIEQHRDRVVVMSEQGQQSLTFTVNDDRVCVGDWLLFDEQFRVHQNLERQSLFERKAPGSKVETQLIASNIDTVMIVSSLNHDFSLSRIERYLILAREAMVEPVILLTKADLCEDADDKLAQVQQLDTLLEVHTLNALDEQDIQSIEPHCRNGQTIAFIGSSGVGKSTLVNSLLGFESMLTGGIREEDSKGRHTTTHRALKVMPNGGLLMDTPGMRELQLGSSEQGVSETFSEITELAQKCRFSDCSHGNEPGCAVQRALKASEITERRLNSYQKLLKEQAVNGATLAEKRSKDKALGKLINSTQSASKKFKKGY
ncbi:putative ribosome biogenesis GTPase RsgA [Vibrio inusitatus NBRC 102082]|uniref:Small ribosomal subunit biogenesis GTPase RsgA n=1 Tax=Vibrio inusitatus NBRC 102082 TaxID=1219070 RepID=A0A4Y3HYM4_9VIBR|nr:ribosome small subunit-dependent GTPase A [Vibrio inusitatus]GEA52283.1 putative ribosome biogenesis GTPase RsgA [Vibrio inusitatus NBRC 102082]